MPKDPLIELEIDTLEAYDYENIKNAKYNIDQLKIFIQNEIQYF